MTPDQLLLLKLVEAIRDRDLSRLAEEQRRIEALARDLAELQITMNQTSPALDLEWPGVRERWRAVMQSKLAMQRARAAQAEVRLQPARDAARRSFGRAIALRSLFEGGT